ncbi:Fic family protein [Tangfeifania diversioriginum]|uniref:Fic family protein n=1 Tax=Tangfeifania diversioriginum TaxID=1168035 RepID=A0A1M6I5R6_9BACT|nr:Fic family protein [Tangfeifania diversioriginum]SHJ29775.1 Fic family protein [Tangfeifania diversioriginum]
MNNNCISQKITVFRGKITPEEGFLVGYGAIILHYDLKVPVPNILSLISQKDRKYQKEEWQVFTPRYKPNDTLLKQLVFALKYEGVNLLVFKKLFEILSTHEINELVQIEPLSQYSRKIWFLYEWLFADMLDIPDLNRGNFADLIDEKIQFAVKGTRSSRQRIINNLPGTPEFCPLIYKTEKLEKYIASNVQLQKKNYLSSIHKDVMQRASSFLLLKDSQASFTIEGESPGTKRALRWGKAIGEAGKNPLSKEELLRLQGIIIESKRFTKLGFRTEGGFVGEHDRLTGEPIPEHISAKWQDLDKLIDGLIHTAQYLEKEKLDPVLTATSIAFGFVFIHPFSDGNGRIHRFLIHHILAKMGLVQQGVIFPVSASILDKIDEYRIILESYSHPVMELIEWETTPEHNVKVLNETINFYRYFDATKQAEFLFDCVFDTINRIIPEEVDYILKYDEFKRFIDDQFEMPDKLVATLVRFLEQNNGQLSNRARTKEFAKLKDKEVNEIEKVFREVFEG